MERSSIILDFVHRPFHFAVSHNTYCSTGSYFLLNGTCNCTNLLVSDFLDRSTAQAFLVVWSSPYLVVSQKK